MANVGDRGARSQQSCSEKVVQYGVTYMGQEKTTCPLISVEVNSVDFSVWIQSNKKKPSAIMLLSLFPQHGTEVKNVHF